MKRHGKILPIGNRGHKFRESGERLSKKMMIRDILNLYFADRNGIPVGISKERMWVKDRSWKTLIDDLGIRWGA